MPELPDISLYLEALQRRILGQRLERVKVLSPFLLRTATPPLQSICGRKVTAVRRLGRRIALGFENDLWLVFHLNELLSHLPDRRQIARRPRALALAQARLAKDTGGTRGTPGADKNVSSLMVTDGPG
jgi:formamidopyrimidine-DNA glycosylase